MYRDPRTNDLMGCGLRVLGKQPRQELFWRAEGLALGLAMEALTAWLGSWVYALSIGGRVSSEYLEHLCMSVDGTGVIMRDVPSETVRNRTASYSWNS